MDALALLKADHKVVADLFEQVEKTSPSKHPDLFKRIKAELDVHAHIEENIFYPKLKAEGTKELVDIVLEGIEEHHQIKMFLAELESLSGKAEEFEPKLTVLIEDTEHHVKEEEGEMFTLVRKQFDKKILDELGEKMEAEKEKYKASHKPAPGKSQAA